MTYLLDSWLHPSIVTWIRLLLDSFRHWTGRELISRLESPQEEAQSIFKAPFVVVSHTGEEDPILNYGNQAALVLWETTWEEFTRTPSRLTAELVKQAERRRMLAQAQARGFIDNYRGVRVSMKGRRFLVEHALVWNVRNAQGRAIGQAATFSQWTFL
jgi:hypothetical protein